MFFRFGGGGFCSFFVVCLVGRTLIYEKSPLNKSVSNENCKTNNNSLKISS